MFCSSWQESCFFDDNNRKRKVKIRPWLGFSLPLSLSYAMAKLMTQRKKTKIFKIKTWIGSFKLKPTHPFYDLRFWVLSVRSVLPNLCFSRVKKEIYSRPKIVNFKNCYSVRNVCILLSKVIVHAIINAKVYLFQILTHIFFLSHFSEF